MHSGFFIVLAIVIVLWIVMNRTSFGYKIQCVGKSFPAAEYAGINTNRMFLIVVSLSAGLAGMAGAIEVMGVYGFTFDQVTHGFGYLGTTTALLSNLRFLYLIPATFLVAFLLAAGESVKIIAGAPAETSHLLLSFVLLGTLLYLYLQDREKIKVRV
jgi:simple sugar transport system permease protein